MKVGDPLKSASIDKFLTIHKLFDNGHFKLDMKKEPTQSGNANDVWVYVQKEHIDVAWKQLQDELKLKENDKREMTPPVTISVTPKKKKIISKDDLDKKPSSLRLILRRPRGKQLRLTDENDDETYEDLDTNKKSTKSKNQQRREKKQTVNTFVENDSDLPLERLTLHSFK